VADAERAVALRPLGSSQRLHDRTATIARTTPRELKSKSPKLESGDEELHQLYEYGESYPGEDRPPRRQAAPNQRGSQRREQDYVQNRIGYAPRTAEQTESMFDRHVGRDGKHGGAKDDEHHGER